MSQMLAASTQAYGSEKGAKSPASAQSPSVTSTAAPKLRSCVVCRTRKVRCDKQSPCSNCRRAKIPCVAPSIDRPPRWAQRLERLPTGSAAVSKAPSSQKTGPRVGNVIDRLHKLESLVQELSSQLDQARAATASSSGTRSAVNSPGDQYQHQDAELQEASRSTADTGIVPEEFGRLVLQDTSHSRYISSGFWSRINDELDHLRADNGDVAEDDSNSSADEASRGKTPSTQGEERTTSERHAFLFQHSLTPSHTDLRELHPLPSQIPFLLDVFSENVNIIIQIVHMPTITKVARDFRDSGMKECTPANEALIFSIYYAAIISMDEDEVVTNFGFSKDDLSLKYRLGLEQALAKADFLNSPDIILIQAFTIFLCIVRRHDSPRYVGMMTGLVIRMAQYVGLQRDGSHFTHLTPYEIEMRRRVWWAICALDLRVSEDQGTDLAITSGSFDTKIPLNINDGDIDPTILHTPTERDGITDVSIARIFFGMSDIMRQITAAAAKDGVAGLEDQHRLLEQIYQKFEDGYCRHTTESGNIIYWVGVTIARLVASKMTLIIYLPVLFSPPSETFSDELRSRLLVSAIEVAEYNHVLNAEQACRQWRWVYQTYTHWHAIVYLLIEISRRPWSQTVERAWVVLHSSWLIPVQTSVNRNLRIWVPLKKLMSKASKHREAELIRLRTNHQAALQLEEEDQKLPLPSSPGALQGTSSTDLFRKRWRQLLNIPEAPAEGTTTYVDRIKGLDDSSAPNFGIGDATRHFMENPDSLTRNSTKRTQLGINAQHSGLNLERPNLRVQDESLQLPSLVSDQNNPVNISEPTVDPLPAFDTDWFVDEHISKLGFTSWPSWTDYDTLNEMPTNLEMEFKDVDMRLGDDVNWYSWVESAKNVG